MSGISYATQVGLNPRGTQAAFHVRKPDCNGIRGPVTPKRPPSSNPRPARTGKVLIGFGAFFSCNPSMRPLFRALLPSRMWPMRLLLGTLLLPPLTPRIAARAAGQPPAFTPVIRITALNPVTRPAFQRFDFHIQVSEPTPDPESLDGVHLDLFIGLPSGASLVLPAFAHQPYQVAQRPGGSGRMVDWLYPAGEPRWEARFTPTQPGRHTASARLQIGLLTYHSESVSFDAAAPARPPFVRVHPKDPRFFSTLDGSPFFPVGLNLAFIGPSQYLTLERFDSVLAKMAASGANFARIWTGCEDWALGLEARKSAWGRSWDWQPPFVAQTGAAGYHDPGWVILLGEPEAASRTLAPTAPIALLASTRYRLTGYARSAPKTPASSPLSLNVSLEGHGTLAPVRPIGGKDWQSFEAEFVTAPDEWWLPNLRFTVPERQKVLLKALSLREAAGGPELLGEADPNRSLRGRVNPFDCAMLDHLVESAENQGVMLQLCLFTRDHYRSDLADAQSPAYARATKDAQNLLRYAVARWGYSPSLFAWEYFNEMDPNAPTARFHDALGRYLRQADPYHHLRTTSGWAPAPAHWTHPELDIADLHWYLRPSWGELSHDAAGAVLDRATLLRRHAADRPAVLGEFGLADDRWGLSPWMRRDPEGIHFHNALWASAFSGLSGTASFWWWETIDQLDYYHHFRPLTEFLRGLPWASPHLMQAQSATSQGSRALLWQNHTAVYGWIANPQATWWKRVEDRIDPTPIDSDHLDVSGLVPGSYQLLWLDTWQGTPIATTAVEVRSDRPCTLDLPGYTTDVAFRLLPNSEANPLPAP